MISELDLTRFENTSLRELTKIRDALVILAQYLDLNDVNVNTLEEAQAEIMARVDTSL